jgi:hypothetical protein
MSYIHIYGLVPAASNTATGVMQSDSAIGTVIIPIDFYHTYQKALY